MNQATFVKFKSAAALENYTEDFSHINVRYNWMDTRGSSDVMNDELFSLSYLIQAIILVLHVCTSDNLSKEIVEVP